jgi:PKD repeat protein
MGQVINSLRHPQNRGRATLVVIAAILLLLLCVALICWWWPFPPPSCDPPVAGPDGPYTVGEGQPLTFNGSGSTGCNITFNWDFGDGTGKGSGASPNYTYPDGPAQYTVTLIVTDDTGRTASATTQVTVNNLPPTPEAGGPYTCQINETIQLSGECNDPSPVDQQTLSCTWADFSGAAVTQPNYTCPLSPGDITVTLTATDKDGASAQDSALITVITPTVTPTPTIWADADGPYFGVVGTPVAFDGSRSGPPGLIKDYTWNFGDNSSETSPDPAISHTYSMAATYTVTLTVTGTATASGQIAITTTTATINPPLNMLPVAVVKCPPDLRSKDGLCLHFDGNRSFDPDGQIVTYEWDFNEDGVVDSTEPADEYCFQARGSYIVTLIVTDDKGAKGRSSIAIDIP